MFFEDFSASPKKAKPPKSIYVYENSSTHKNPVLFQLKNGKPIFSELRKLLKYKKIRLFNSEGAEYFEDDIHLIKDRSSVYASRGQDFNPQNSFQQYDIGQKLGQGGFGEVFLAKHRHSGKKYAIKIIKITSAFDIDSIFVEVEILKSLKHENIVKVSKCLVLKNMQVAIIMEYLQGGQLLEYVQKQGRLDEGTCRIFLNQIVKGIMYCHESNLIHRDLKLENILLVNHEEKKIKIIDFGIAGVINRLTADQLDTGSLAYMAPECFSNSPTQKFDGRMDVWAIGVILFGLLVGELPFKGNSNYEIKENIRKGSFKIPPDVKKTLSHSCLNFMFRCLEVNPKNRIKIGELSNHEWLSCFESIIQEPENQLNETTNVSKQCSKAQSLHQVPGKENTNDH